MRALILVAFLALAGCTGPEHLYTIAITDSVTAEHELAVREAADDWSRAVPQLHFDVKRVSEYTPEMDTIWVSEVDTIRGTVRARTTWGGIVGAAQMNVTHGAFIPATIEHELGHAMGLSHAACGVMQGTYPAPFPAEHVLPCDAEQYYAVWGGKMGNVTYGP